MRKSIFTILALVLVFGLTACKEGGSYNTIAPMPTLDSTDDTSKANNDDPSEYGEKNSDDWLTMYRSAFEEVMSEYSDFEHLSYYIFDLNDDGVMEILIKGVFSYDEYKWLYALDGNTPVKIGEYWSRNDYTGIYSGGYIYGFGSNSSSDSVYYIKQMAPTDNSLTTTVNVEYHWGEDGTLKSMLNGDAVEQAEAEEALKAYDDIRGEEIVPRWVDYQP